jgi:hypothetical protein
VSHLVGASSARLGGALIAVAALVLCGAATACGSSSASPQTLFVAKLAF